MSRAFSAGLSGLDIRSIFHVLHSFASGALPLGTLKPPLDLTEYHINRLGVKGRSQSLDKLKTTAVLDGVI